MYYFSLAAYSIFFNASRCLLILTVFLLASLYVFLAIEKAKIFHELAALACKQEGRNLVHLQFQETSAYNHSNGSYYNDFRDRRPHTFETGFMDLTNGSLFGVGCP
ncbi:hypothetical protein PRUPE_4G137200, partial [Prunus persica]